MHGVTYPLRPSTEAHGAQLMTNTVQLPSIVRAKRVQDTSLKSSHSRSRMTSTSSSTRQRVVPVESVMAMNKEAMAILQEGDIAASYTKLIEALLAAETGVRRCGGSSSGARTSGEGQLEAWLIGFATTLSNLGCVQRRANELQDALLYLEDARKVESNVFGKPSCSTMVNLSAVLLGLGRANEALTIAHECVTASASCDPMLHVIALHNYGVTLSVHTSPEVRQQAAPVLMQALREAESCFGGAHQTTILIRERCGLLTKQPLRLDDRTTTSRTPSSQKTSVSFHSTAKRSSKSPQSRQLSQIQSHQKQQHQKRKQQQQQQQQQKPPQTPPPQQQQQQQQQERTQAVPVGPLPPLISSAQKRAKEALQTLDYGVPFAPLHQSSQRSPVDNVELLSASQPLHPLTLGESHTTHKSEEERRTPQESSVRCRSSDPMSVCVDSLLTISLRSRLSHDTLQATFSAELESIECDTVNDGEKTDDGKCAGHIQTTPKIQEISRDESVSISSHPRTDTSITRIAYPTPKRPRPPSGLVGSYVDMRGQRPSQEPSFFRFAPPLTLETSPAVQSSAPISVVRPPATSISGSLPTTVQSAPFEEEEEIKSPAVRTHEAFKRTIGVSPATRREQRLRNEFAEETALRTERRLRAKAEAEQAYFEETLAAIIARTRDRAARAIQYTWLYWWRNTGRRRRELRERREAERVAREKKRRALMLYEARTAEAQRLRRESAAAKSAAAAAVMKCAVRCGKKWLARTAAVRAAARGLLSGPARGESAWTRCVARVQAVWRGRVTRAAVRALAAEAQRARAARAAVERRALAALVLVQAWRAAKSREALRARREAFLAPVVTRLQRWARAAMAQRRARGADCVSRMRRTCAARRIQRQWRAREALLAQCMTQLRAQLDETRGVEATAARVLQRCGRGCMDRRNTARMRALAHKLRKAQEHVRGYDVAPDEADMKSCIKRIKEAPKPLYVPTPAAEVAAIAERERELCHIGLFVEPVAQRTFKEWEDALRLRPFDVRLRRAHENHLCTLERRTIQRERAARCIQREFRRWLRIRDDAFRDNTLLLINRGRYQEDELGKKVEDIRHRREVDGGKKIFGDQTEPMRAEIAVVRAELEEVEPLVRSYVPYEEIRCEHERYDTEQDLRRDEELLKKIKREDEIACARETLMCRAIEELVQSPRTNFAA